MFGTSVVISAFHRSGRPPKADQGKQNEHLKAQQNERAGAPVWSG